MKQSDLKAIVLAILFIGIIFGHAQAPQQQPKILTITLSLTEWEVVLEGLEELPLKKSGPIHAKIQQQAYVQMNPPVKSDSTKPKKN